MYISCPKQNPKNHTRQASDTSGLNPFSTCNKVAYNSPTEASDYEIRKGLRDQLLFSIQFVKKPAKWNYEKKGHKHKCTSCVQVK